MKRVSRPGSAFRDKRPIPDTTTPELEGALFTSGLLGKTPQKHQIVHIQIDDVETPRKNKNEPDISIPSYRKNSSRSKTTLKNTKNTIQTPRAIRSELSPRVQKLKDTLNSEIPPLSQDITQLPDETPNEISWQLYSQIVGKSDPPTGANFQQLSEVLDRLLTTPNLESHHSYHSIFGEMIRQFTIECNEIGTILQECRSEFNKGKIQLPKILKYYQKVLKDKKNEIQKVLDTINPLESELEEKEKKRQKLNEFIIELKNDSKVLVSHYDELVKKLTFAQREVDEVREQYKKLGVKIDRKNEKMLDINNQLRILDQVASKYTTDTLNFHEQLSQIKAQFEETKKSTILAEDEMNNIKSLIARTDREIEQITQKFEETQKAPKKADILIQVDIIPRRLFSSKEEDKKTEQTIPRIKKMESIYSQIKLEYDQLTHHESENPIVIDSYDDFSVIKTLIAKYDDSFHFDEADVKDAENGFFFLDQDQGQDQNPFIMIFASKIMEDLMIKAIRNIPVSTNGTQTLMQPPKIIPPESEIVQIKSNHPLLSLVSSDYSKRQPKKFPWILEQIRLLYQSKYIVDSESLSKGEELIDFSSFIVNFANKKFGLEYLRDQYCYDLYITGNEHADRSPEVSTFCRFLDGDFSTEQLGFFLTCRADCIAIGSSVPIRTKDLLEVYNEFYLSDEQIKKILPQWFGKRYRKDIFTAILEYSVSRPSVSLEITKKYVTMHDLLLYCIYEFADDSIRRLDELFLSTRIVPRLTKNQFKKLCLLLIPKLKTEEIENLHRSTVSKSKARNQVSVEQFAKLYLKGTLLKRREDNINQGDYLICNEVTHMYNKKKVLFNNIIEYFRQQTFLKPDDLTLKTFFDDTLRYQSMLEYSMEHGDGNQACIYFYSFIGALDIMFSNLNQITQQDLAPSLKSFECSCHENWIEKSV